MEILSQLSTNQKKEVFKYVEDIIGDLDEYALREMLSGNERDFDLLFDSIVTETANALYTNKGPLKVSSFHYLDKLTNSFNNELTYRSLNYFVLSVLPNFEVNTHHLEWGNLVQFYNKLGILASRDHGKSYYFSFAYPIWKLFRYERGSLLSQGKGDAHRRGMIITNEYSLAADFLKLIKEEIEENPLLREKLYPINGESWGADEITCKNRANLKVKGAGSALRGRHPGWIVIDDYLDDSALYNSEAREKQISHFHSVIMNMIVPGGQVIVVGTPFHKEDLYADLKIKKGWKIFEYPAIYPDGRVLWSDRYTLRDLLDKKSSIGNVAFTREFLVRPISSDSSIFPWSILETSFKGMEQYTIIPNIYSSKRKFKKVVLGCDFAISSSVGADYSAFITLGVDEMENFWLLNVWHKQGASYNEQIAVIKKLRSQFKYDIIMAEDNAFQKVMIQICEDNGIPVIPHTTGAKNKYDFKIGVPAMAVLFEQGRYRFPRGNVESKNITDMVCNELNSIAFTDKGLQGVGGHDDLGISLWIATTACHYVHSSFSFNFI